MGLNPLGLIPQLLARPFAVKGEPNISQIYDEDLGRVKGNFGLAQTIGYPNATARLNQLAHQQALEADKIERQAAAEKSLQRPWYPGGGGLTIGPQGQAVYMQQGYPAVEGKKRLVGMDPKTKQPIYVTEGGREAMSPSLHYMDLNNPSQSALMAAINQGGKVTNADGSAININPPPENKGTGEGNGEGNGAGKKQPTTADIGSGILGRIGDTASNVAGVGGGNIPRMFDAAKEDLMGTVRDIVPPVERPRSPVINPIPGRPSADFYERAFDGRTDLIPEATTPLSVQDTQSALRTFRGEPITPTPGEPISGSPYSALGSGSPIRGLPGDLPPFSKAIPPTAAPVVTEPVKADDKTADRIVDNLDKLIAVSKDLPPEKAQEIIIDYISTNAPVIAAMPKEKKKEVAEALEISPEELETVLKDYVEEPAAIVTEPEVVEPEAPPSPFVGPGIPVPRMDLMGPIREILGLMSPSTIRDTVKDIIREGGKTMTEEEYRRAQDQRRSDNAAIKREFEASR